MFSGALNEFRELGEPIYVVAHELRLSPELPPRPSAHLPVEKVIEDFKGFLLSIMSQIGQPFSDKMISRKCLGLDSIETLQLLWSCYMVIERSLFWFFDTVEQTSIYSSPFFLAKDQFSAVLKAYISIQHYLRKQPTLLILLMLSNLHKLRLPLPNSFALAIKNILQQGLVANAQEVGLYIEFLYGQHSDRSQLIDYKKLPNLHRYAWKELPPHPFVGELNKYNKPALLASRAWQNLWVLRHYTVLFKAADTQLSREHSRVSRRADYIAWCLQFQLLYNCKDSCLAVNSLRLLAKQSPLFTTAAIDEKRNIFCAACLVCFQLCFKVK